MPSQETLAEAEDEDFDMEVAIEIYSDMLRVEAEEKQEREKHEEFAFIDPNANGLALPPHPSLQTGVYIAPPMPTDDDDLVYPTIDI